MKRTCSNICRVALYTSICAIMCLLAAYAQGVSPADNLDAQVNTFLNQAQNTWRDMNVPEADGQAMYDIIVKNGYTRAVEVGTSTGHSTIWLAWAMSKTGGKVITIELDEGRYKQAVANFKKAGVSEYIDARLANAHELVPQLKGTFDFAFLDADKDWYVNYAKALVPKMKQGGCITGHNISGRRRGWIKDFLDYMENHEELETSILRVSRSGLSVSYKK
jgi:caffeoyl-CoA O-methyltransferase